MAEKADVWTNPANESKTGNETDPDWTTKNPVESSPNEQPGTLEQPEKSEETQRTIVHDQSSISENTPGKANKDKKKVKKKGKAHLRNRANWLIYKLYVRGEDEKCLRIIENQLLLSKGLNEYPLFVKALLKRKEGKIEEALELFQTAARLNPKNSANHKQVGRCLFLLAKHKIAIEVYEEALTISPHDWEIFHNKALCHMYMKNYDAAIDCFQEANSIERHDITFLQLSKVYSVQEKYQQAIDVLLEAIEFSPENPEILTTLGLLYIRTEDGLLAFDYLGSSLTQDPHDSKTILAAGSMIQEKSDVDVALIKYRVAAVHTPNSAQLWNNIGMCFFSKKRFVAAVACLKRALTFEPLEWIISHNMGLVYLHTCQYASAFHYFSASMNLKPDYAPSYMYLAVTLSRLDDFDTACSAYEKAIEMEPSNYTFRLNYAVTLFNSGEFIQSKEQYDTFCNLFNSLDQDKKKTVDGELINMGNTLSKALESC